jgi:hypothetical protein
VKKVIGLGIALAIAMAGVVWAGQTGDTRDTSTEICQGGVCVIHTIHYTRGADGTWWATGESWTVYPDPNAADLAPIEP